MDDIKLAMLGNGEAAKRLTDAGVLVPCWRCGGEAELQEIHTGGKPVYAAPGRDPCGYEKGVH